MSESNEMTLNVLPYAAQREVLILFGSQTGCSKDVARRIARELRRHHFLPNVMPMDSVDIAVLPSTERAVFVCSTTGQGETPDNMKKLWRFLRRADLPSDSLMAMKYSTFGLGDSNYPIYNAVARRLHERLRNLGATPILHRGLGDDQHPMGHDGALKEWLPAFVQALKETYTQDLVDSWPAPVADLFSAPMFNTCVLRFPRSDSSIASSEESLKGLSSVLRRLETLRSQLADLFSSKDAVFGTTLPALASTKPTQDSNTNEEKSELVETLDLKTIEYARTHDPGCAWTLANVPACAPLSSTPGETLFAAPLAASHMIVHPEHEMRQRVKHLIFDLREMQCQEAARSFKPGAVISICAPQPTSVVKQGLARLQLHPLDIVFIAPSSLSSSEDSQNVDFSHQDLYEEYADQILSAHCDPSKPAASFPEYPSSWPTPHALLSMLDPDSVSDYGKVANFADKTPMLQLQHDTEVPPVLFAYELVSRYLDLSGRTSRTILPYLEQSAESVSIARKAELAILQASNEVKGFEIESTIAKLKDIVSSAEYESERLRDFQTPEWAIEWERYCVREGRSFLELMDDFPHANLPLNWLLEIVPRPSPRQFSIASSSLYQSSSLATLLPSSFISSTTELNGTVDPSKLYNPLPSGCSQAHVCLAQVRYTTPYKRMKLGLCSTYLASLQPQHNGASLENINVTTPFVWASLREPTFKYPVDPAIPLVMIGPGTGVAVFHAIAEHRTYLLKDPTLNIKPPVSWKSSLSNGCNSLENEEGSEVCSARMGKARLFFGCRYSENGDWYYADFFNRCTNEYGSLTHYDALFSRDHLRTGKTVDPSKTNEAPIDRYVQHRMVRDSDVAFDIFQILFEEKGIFLLSGNSKQMPSDVKKALVAIVEACYPTPGDTATMSVAQEGLPTSVPRTGSKGEVIRGISEDQAKMLVQRLMDEGRFIQECWG